MSRAPGIPAPGAYDVLMLDETADGYPISMRFIALAGLFVVGAIAFILIDIAMDGKLTGCKDCDEDKAAADA